MNLFDLIKKRHPEPAWAVIDEVSNSTGGNAQRRADAVAIGLWPSHGFAVHGFEIKVSRSDLVRELADPSKADPVGKYCDHWWLVVNDEKLLDGVALPASWGALAPRGQVLRTVVKAPKREATPITRGFVAALTRRVLTGYVPKAEYRALEKRIEAEAQKRAQEISDRRAADAEYELRRLRQRLEQFEERAGIKLDEYTMGEISAAVAEVMHVRQRTYMASHRPLPVAGAFARTMAARLRMGIEQQEREIERVRQQAAAIDDLIAKDYPEAVNLDPDDITY